MKHRTEVQWRIVDGEWQIVCMMQCRTPNSTEPGTDAFQNFCHRFLRLVGNTQGGKGIRVADRTEIDDPDLDVMMICFILAENL